LQTIHRRFSRQLNRSILIQIFCVASVLAIALFGLLSYQAFWGAQQAIERFKNDQQQLLTTEAANLDRQMQTVGEATLLLATQASEMVSAPGYYENTGLALSRHDGYYRNSTKTGGFTLYTEPVSTINSSLRRELRSFSLLLPLMEHTRHQLSSDALRISAHLDNRITLSTPALQAPLTGSADRNITEEAPFHIFLTNPRKQWRFLPQTSDAKGFGQMIAPIFKEAELMGVVTTTLPTRMLQEWLALLERPESTYALIRHEKLGLLATTPQTPATVQEDPDQAPKGVIVLEAPIGQSGLKLQIAGQKSAITADAYALYEKLLLIAAGIVLFVGLFYLIFFLRTRKQARHLTQSITQPLDEIVRFSHDIGMRTAGRLAPSGIKELDDLANHLHLAHSKLMQMLIVDELTGTSNRRKLLLDLKERGHWGLVVLNLNRFKYLNDVFGYAAGDYVLKRTVELLDALECDSCETYRIGADEFALLFEAEDDDATLALAKEVQTTLHEGLYLFNDIELEISASIGCALGDHKDGQRLLSRADIALSHARKNPHATLVLYHPDLENKKEHEANLYWERRIKEALRNDTMVPWFQPIGELRSNRWTRFEALVRIVERGEVIPPYYFLEAARKTGLLFEIARRMIDRTFAQAARHEGIAFSINLALSDLEHSELLTVIDTALQRHGVSADRFTFELLETEAMEESDATHKMVHTLKERGFKIAIDDFGSGYSNFSRFMGLPVDYLKIDGQFIKNLHRDETARHVVRAILEFAEGMGAEVVAEYVETRHIYEAVKRFDIAAVQGFYLSKPVPPEEMAALIKR
jgi:diguanylate cyclase (GGDEF)-like protein